VDLKSENLKLSKRIDELETHKRCENIIIRGLPKTSYAERASGCPSGAAMTTDNASFAETSLAVEKAVITLCRDRLGITVAPPGYYSSSNGDLSSTSLSERNEGHYTSNISPFHKSLDSVYFAKKALRNDSSRAKIFISVHLTKDVGDIFFEARKLVREKKLSSRGVIFVKRSSQSDERPSVKEQRGAGSFCKPDKRLNSTGCCPSCILAYTLFTMFMCYILLSKNGIT